MLCIFFQFEQDSLLFEIRIKKPQLGDFFFPLAGFFFPRSRLVCKVTFIAKVWTVVQFRPGFL